jgi:hypothetical protein
MIEASPTWMPGRRAGYDKLKAFVARPRIHKSRLIARRCPICADSGPNSPLFDNPVRLRKSIGIRSMPVALALARHWIGSSPRLEPRKILSRPHSAQPFDVWAPYTEGDGVAAKSQSKSMVVANREPKWISYRTEQPYAKVTSYCRPGFAGDGLLFSSIGSRSGTM